MRAATGNALVLGLSLGRSGEFGVPAGGLVGYGGLLPVTAGLVGQESPSGQINPSGFKRRGVPGPKGGAFEFRHPLTAAHLLEFFEHILGSTAKAEPEPGVFQYTFDPSRDGVDSHFWALAAQPPVEYWLLHGIKFHTLELEIGDNTEVPVTLSGDAAHGTRLGLAEPNGANAGAYILGPWLRGLLAEPADGDIWLRVEALSPLSFKTLQAPALPDPGTWAAAPSPWPVLLGVDGAARWQNLQSSATRFDLGVWAENKDPLEVIWPGSAVDHSALAVGDVFRFPVSWSAPALAEIGGAHKLTSAHWLTRFRRPGEPDYRELPVTSGKVTLGWPTVVRRGNSSRYPHDIERPGQLLPAVELVRSFVDLAFADAFDRHQRLDLQLAWEGRQMGSGALREGLEITLPSAGLVSDARPTSSPDLVEETVQLEGETDDAGSLPCRVVVTTTRDWTPSS